jgi:hypothetical protein
MDISQEFVRRQARDIEAAHRQAMKQDRTRLDHLVNSDPGALEADPVMGSLNRRQLLMFGGAGIAMTAVVAACKGATPPVSVTPATTATTAAVGTANDVAILRTASSIEALAVSVYTTALKTGLVTTATTASLLKLFQGQHAQHGDLFQRSTRTAGGTPLADPNPVLMQQLVQPRLAALMTEADVVNLAYDLEHLAAATYQADIGTFNNVKFNTTVGSVGATEARHVALLAVISGKSATGTPDDAFQKDQDAAKAGTGV